MSENATDSNTEPMIPDEAVDGNVDPVVPEAAISDPVESFHDAKRITIPVNPARLAWGRYDQKRNRDAGEGDIHASYSADTIASAGKIRKSFRWQAQLMVTVSLSRRDGIEQAEAYQLIPLTVFSGATMSYAEKIGTAENAEAARNDPNGFYHDMTVTQGRETFVLSGPPIIFVAEEGPARPSAESQSEEPLQMNLFYPLIYAPRFFPNAPASANRWNSIPR
jgi:hypothetical protein